MKTTDNSRRTFMQRCLSTGIAVLTGTLVLTACRKSNNSEARAKAESPVDACDDLTNVSESDIAVRQKLGYVKESPIPDNQCHNCNLYLPPKEGQKCGGCMLFKGPVFASAYCTYWAPKI